MYYPTHYYSRCSRCESLSALYQYKFRQIMDNRCHIFNFGFDGTYSPPAIHVSTDETNFPYFLFCETNLNVLKIILNATLNRFSFVQIVH